MARKALSKRTRFEIFKRDGFRCAYCGATPAQAELAVDHVVAVANGGTNDLANLITACSTCNAGKSAVPLERKTLPPPRSAEAMADHAEQIRAYLEEQRRLTAAKQEVVEEIGIYWEENVGPISQFMFDRLPGLVESTSPELLREAMDVTARKMGTPGRPYEPRDAINQGKYFHGVLRRRREQGAR
jgi:hypothetical protein